VTERGRERERKKEWERERKSGIALLCLSADWWYELSLFVVNQKLGNHAEYHTCVCGRCGQWAQHPVVIG
jgi:hypothetical protein